MTGCCSGTHRTREAARRGRRPPRPLSRQVAGRRRALPLRLQGRDTYLMTGRIKEVVYVHRPAREAASEATAAVEEHTAPSSDRRSKPEEADPLLTWSYVKTLSLCTKTSRGGRRPREGGRLPMGQESKEGVKPPLPGTRWRKPARPQMPFDHANRTHPPAGRTDSGWQRKLLSRTRFGPKITKTATAERPLPIVGRMHTSTGAPWSCASNAPTCSKNGRGAAEKSFEPQRGFKSGTTDTTDLPPLLTLTILWVH